MWYRCKAWYSVLDPFWRLKNNHNNRCDYNDANNNDGAIVLADWYAWTIDLFDKSDDKIIKNQK